MLQTVRSLHISAGRRKAKNHSLLLPHLLAALVFCAHRLTDHDLSQLLFVCWPLSILSSPWAECMHAAVEDDGVHNFDFDRDGSAMDDFQGLRAKM